MKSRSENTTLLSLRIALLRVRTVAFSPVGSSFASSALILVVATITGVILARALGPAGRGTLTAVLLLPGIVNMLGSLGLTQSATVWATDNHVALGTLSGTLLLIAFFQSVLLIPLGLILIYALMGGYAEATRHLMMVFLVSYIPVTTITSYGMAILQGRSYYRRFNFVRAFVFVVPAIAFPFLLFMQHLTVLSATLTYMSASLATLILAIYWTVPLIDTPLRVCPSLGADMLRFGARSYLGNVSGALNERLDQAVMAVLLDPTQLGLYVIAVTTSSPVSLVGMSVSIPAMPAAARSDSLAMTRALSARYLAVTLVLSVVAMLPLLLLTPWLVDLVFGSAFLGAVPAARILLMATVMLSFSGVLSALLTGMRQPLVASLGQVMSLSVTVVGLLVLLPLLGLTGAALTSLAAYLVANGYMLTKLAAALERSTLAFAEEIIEEMHTLPRKLRSNLHAKSLAAETAED